MNRECPFCSEINDPTYYKKAIDEEWPFADRILLENDGAIAVPALGPLIYPMALVIPRRCCSSFLTAESDQRQAMLDLVHQLAKSGVFGASQSQPHDVLILEHGGATNGADGTSCQCIAHCHLHVCVDIGVIVEWFRDGDLAESVRFHLGTDREESPYLFAGWYKPNNPDSGLRNQIVGWYDKSGTRKRPRYFRGLIADRLQLGGHGSDWRRKMNRQWMISLYQAFHP